MTEDKEVKTHTVLKDYTPEELCEVISEGIRSQVRGLESEIKLEDLKSNGDRAKITAFQWGAVLLTGVADAIARYPLQYEIEEEIVEDPFEVLPPTEEPVEVIDLGEVVLEIHQEDVEDEQEFDFSEVVDFLTYDDESENDEDSSRTSEEMPKRRGRPRKDS